MMGDPAVRVSNVSKRFRLGQTHDSLGELIAGATRRLLGRFPRRTEPSTFWALRDLSFTVAPGEAIGLIGPNGAGKSTALRLLARILRPDRGTVEVDGRLAALIEVGAGFHGDLTGRENVYLNGAILGMTRDEIRRKLDAIVSFAGIERFLDMPVKRYSSGMYARLGFSIAAHVDPHVLLVDEVLSVGDALFRVRCLERMHELVREGTTLVFVTHQLDQMQSICGRALVLEQGRLTYEGTGQKAVGHYLKVMSRAYAHRPPDLADEQDRQGEAVEMTALRFYDDTGEEVIWVRPRDRVQARLVFRLRRPIRRLIVELSMRASLTENLLCFNSGRDGITFDAPAGTHTLTLTLPRLGLAGGQYFWNVRMWDADTGAAELDTPFRYPLAIDDEGRKTGVVCVEHDWALSTDTDDDGSRPPESRNTPGEVVQRSADRDPVEPVRIQGACCEHLPLR
jgi:ABC-type polysaccharide/polyol phosphate transport system ATPase subunit